MILLRLLNLLLWFPMMIVVLGSITIYPIVGYVLGRGFENSVHECHNLVNPLIESPIGAIKVIYHMYKLIISGRCTNDN